MHVHANVTPAEAAKLGNELTPMGAVRAGNADGSIPAWTGGITEVPAGYQTGDHHPNPFAADEVLFTIDGTNYQQYAEFLSPGQQALFAKYPETYKMPIYQSRRSASYPQYVYDASIANASSAELLNDGNGLKNATIGVPFPMPQNGLEAIWNHILRFRGTEVTREGGQVAMTESGAYTYIGFDDQLKFRYAEPGVTAAEIMEDNILFKFKQEVTEPSRLAGTALLVHETVDQVTQPRQAWTYNTGQRRVRRAPNVAFDTPGTASDGLRTTDDFDMYNGSPNRYTWELKGKQELYVAYNSYDLHSDQITYDQILTPGHINPEFTRYEKHRVWVVEATIKPEFRHVYSKRVYYIDEDSWQILVGDLYDDRGGLYRVAIAHGLNYYEVPTAWSTLEVLHDLNSGRYLALGLDNEHEMYDFAPGLNDRDFTPQALRRSGRR